MSSKSLSLVNQKLAYSRVLLELAAKRETEVTSLSTLQRSALLEACVNHLTCAYQHYLREVAENFQVKLSAPISTERELIAALAELGKTPSEATELMQLRADDGSWLARLFRSDEQQRSAPTPVSPRATTNDNLIGAVIVDVEAEHITASFQNVSAWQVALTDLVRRQRETSAEY